MIQPAINASRPRILLTGAKGRVARVVAPALSAEFDCSFSDLWPPAAEDENYHQADLCDSAQVDALCLTRYDAIVHLAIASNLNSFKNATDSRVSDQMMMNVNVRGTYNLYETARRAGIKKIVYISSMTVHQGARHRPRYDSQTPTHPRNLYACTKLFGENLAQVYASQHGLASICLRIGQPFPLKFPQDDLWRENKRVRSFYVANEDISQAILCGLRTELSFGVFNIVSASDNQRVEIAEAASIGYRPKGYFSDDGFRLFEDGQCPPVAAEAVTHDNVS